MSPRVSHCDDAPVKLAAQPRAFTLPRVLFWEKKCFAQDSGPRWRSRIAGNVATLISNPNAPAGLGRRSATQWLFDNDLPARGPAVVGRQRARGKLSHFRACCRSATSKRADFPEPRFPQIRLHDSQKLSCAAPFSPHAVAVHSDSRYHPSSLVTAVRSAVSSTAASPCVSGIATFRSVLSAVSCRVTDAR